MVTFLGGLVVGVCIGVVAFALCAISRCGECSMNAAHDASPADLKSVKGATEGRFNG